MKITPWQLKQHKLSPVYLITGDEFLLVQEACETVRKLAHRHGYQERQVFHVETGFAWERFIAQVSNASLFSNQELIELHWHSGLNAAGVEVLQRYLTKPAADKIILMVAGKLDAKQQQTKWYKALEASSTVVPVWPLDAKQLSTWIVQRLAQHHLATDAQGIKLLITNSAGNLLATAQEIDKLSLFYEPGVLTAAQILAVITDNAKFNVFTLLDAALAGDRALVVRIFDQLQYERTENAIILWAITRDLRLLINWHAGNDKGHGKREALLRQTAMRHNRTILSQLLQQAAVIDRMIKGASQALVLEHEICQLLLTLADNKI